jgi:hypothetical protein
MKLQLSYCKYSKCCSNHCNSHKIFNGLAGCQRSSSLGGVQLEPIVVGRRHGGKVDPLVRNQIYVWGGNSLARR